VVMQSSRPVVREDVALLRKRAKKCRSIAELTSDQGLRQDQLRTALAYERMAECAERLFGFSDDRL
jgi:hypothetical protein